jgi:hypothetical protein
MAIVNDYAGEVVRKYAGDVGGWHGLGEMRLGWQHLTVENLTGYKVLALTGRLGRPNRIGLMKMGWSRPGDYFPEGGIYRRNGRWHTQKIVKMVHYRPTNNRLVYQQFWRDYFRNCVSVYHALDPNILELYRQKAKRYRMTGYNLFISQITLKKPAILGNYRLGFTKVGVLTDF